MQKTLEFFSLCNLALSIDTDICVYIEREITCRDFFAHV